MTIRSTILGLAVIGMAGAANAQTVNDVRQYAGGYSSLRVAPIAGQNAVQRIADLLSPGGVNTAIIPSDVLPYVREDHRFHNADWSIGYTAKLDQEEVHILGRQDIRSIADLSGQKVNFDLYDSRAFITGSVLFQALHINVQPVSLDQHVALQLLRRGDIAAIVYVGKAPARLFFDVTLSDGVHFLPVPFTEEVSRTYVQASLNPADYPLLISGGEVGRGGAISTVAVPIVMAVNNGKLSTGRDRDMSRSLGALSSSAKPQQSSLNRAVPTPDRAVPVPGRGHFVASRGQSIHGGSDVSYRTLVPIHHGPLQPLRAKPDWALQSSPAQTQRSSGEPRTAEAVGVAKPNASSNPKPNTTTTLPYTARQRQALFQEFVQWQKQDLSERKVESLQNIFEDFLRTRSEH